MLNRFLIIHALLLSGIAETMAQPVSVFRDAECAVIYEAGSTSVVFTVTDFRPAIKPLTVMTRPGNVGDYRPEQGSVQVEFDKDDNGKFTDGDWGLYSSFGSAGVIGYSLYDGYQGLYMHRLNKGFDIKTRAMVHAATVAQPEGNAIAYRIEVPYMEMVNPVSGVIRFQVSLFRLPKDAAWGYFIELPDKRDEFSHTFQLQAPLARLKEEASKENQRLKAKGLAFSKSRYLTAIEYDGVYIDMGNGKYAELKKIIGENGVIAGMNGTKVQNFYKDVPFARSMATTVLVPKCAKIIFKGASYQGDFMKWLSVHEMENLDQLHLTREAGVTTRIKTQAIAGKFGQQYSLSSDQPESAYTPAVNKETLQDWIRIDFNTKTINENRLEISIAEPLVRGKKYCLWSGSELYFFELQ